MKPVIYLDGKYTKVSRPRLEGLRPGLVAGRGVFETMLYDSGRLHFFLEHMQRLRRGLKALRIRFHVADRHARDIAVSSVKKNRLSRARVRIMVHEDKNGVHFSCVPQKMKAYSRRDVERGFSAEISNVRRDLSKTSHLKTTDYGLFLEAYNSARSRGFDEAILLNSRRHVVEGSRTNVFVVKNGRLFTPPVKSGCLNGIVRQIVLKLAAGRGIPGEIKLLTVQRLKSADEAFLTNSTLGIMPLTKIDGKRVSNGRIGSVTAKLLEAYNILLV